MKRELNDLINRLGQLAEKEGYYLEVIGSFATGLWVKQSNIDLQLSKPDHYDNSLTSK